MNVTLFVKNVLLSYFSLTLCDEMVDIKTCVTWNQE
jgi:hypothetical protein